MNGCKSVFARLCGRLTSLAAIIVPVSGMLGWFGSPSLEAAVPVGFVHTSGSALVNGQNQPLRLNGVNLGQWLMWEQWVMGGDVLFTGEKGLKSTLATLVGTARVDQFTEDLRNNYVTAIDFNAIGTPSQGQGLGLNVVRLPFNHTLLEDDNAPGVYKNSGWARLDNALTWAENANLYVVLDLHAAPCGQSTLFTSDPDSSNLWSADAGPACKQRTINLWKAIAARYANRTVVAGYDLLNEPDLPDASYGSQLVTLYRNIISQIRSVDCNHLVFLEGAAYAKDFSMFPANPPQPIDSCGGRAYSNWAYSYHRYEWDSAGANGEASAKSVAARDGVPLWLGEFGQDNADNVAKYVDRVNIDPTLSGWSEWTWKAAAGNNAVNSVTISATWKKVINWMDIPWYYAQPTAAEAETGMTDFINAVKLANTTRNTLVAQALAPRWSTVKTSLSSNLCIGVANGSSDDGAAVQSLTCNATDASQVWNRTVANPTALMTNGKCLDIYGALNTNGTKVQLYHCTGATNQTWTINPADKTIRALGKCLDLPAGNLTSGTGLQIWDCNGGGNQRWEVSWKSS